MKKFKLLAIAIILTCTSAYAQSNKEEIDMYQSVFGMGKKAILSEYINVPEEKSNEFWELYDEYEDARKKHGQKRIALIEKYAINYSEIGDEKNSELITEMISLANEYNKLINRYYKKINKACGIKVAGQFYQFEKYFQSWIRLRIMDQIPFIGELDNLKK